MKSCQSVAALLPLSAGGLLDAAGERQLREHLRQCRECAARLETLGNLAAALAALPAPVLPAGLILRTEGRLASEFAAADRRLGGILALAGAAIGWVSWFALWDLYRGLTGGMAALLRPGWPNFWAWLALSTLMAFLAAPVAAALVRARRIERRIL